MEISSGNIENISRAARVINGGGIVAFPTETVYGLGADALNPLAVSRIFEAKGRPYFDPLIVHIADISWLERLSFEVPPQAMVLARRFWPGPLTLVLKKTGMVPDIVTAGLDTVGIRMPSHPVALDLIRECGTPVAAPSANPFGYISPTSARHVLAQMGDRVDMILDGGECSVGVESTIIRIDGSGAPVLLRPGGTEPERIAEIAGPLATRTGSGTAPESPGQLPYHYSPVTPVRVVDDFSGLDISDKRAGYVYFMRKGDDTGTGRIAFLSRQGDMREAAANLFSVLHRLDALGLSVIYAEKVPLQGLGVAIMDRLARASKRGRESVEGAGHEG
ncbi:MAG TPA: L-threonylcarbamoyladenylate synthase [Spirochaetota bacterium]|nr:L-threonylcarbamoyladenylate synthase [Spirochaetota bacterium]